MTRWNSIFRITLAFLLFTTHANSMAAGPAIKLKSILPPVVEAKPAKPGAKPVPLKKEQERANAQARTEKQALDDLSKGDSASGLRRYAGLAKALTGSRLGGAVDLRILEIHRLTVRPGDSPAAFQKAIISTQEKYKDENILGAANKQIVQKISSALPHMHREIVNKQIQLAKAKNASAQVRKFALSAIDTYMENGAAESEKERLRASKGEIQFLSDNNIAAAATFAALAGEAKGPTATVYWRLAIRSQLILASWPVDAPWDGVGKGSAPARETLHGMYANILKDNDWPIAAQMGLLEFHLSRIAEAFKLFRETLEKNPNGNHAQHAAGLMAFTYIQNKSWQDLEDLSRLMLKINIRGVHLKTSYDARTLLGTALLEGGIDRYNSGDFKASATKLDEFVRGWPGHLRHDQAFYQLALAYQGAKDYKIAIETMVNFTKSYAKSKYRRDGLVSGGAWALATAWEDHVMYFLEAHLKEFGRDNQSTQSLDTLANLYMGRGVYDGASRIMQLQLVHPQISPDTKADIARRLLDMQEKRASPESAVRIADVLLRSFASTSRIAAPAISLKARIQAGENPTKFDAFLRQLNGLPAGDPDVVEALSEVYFLKGEAMTKGVFDREVLSIESRNPINDLNSAYSRFDQIRATYESACVQGGASWCGPAMHRLARVCDQFTKSIEPLSIPATLDPADVQAFQARKRSIIDTVDAKSLSADERAVQQANAGATNPDWTGAILWQNAADWQAERVSGETGNGYIQWHSGSGG